MAVLVSVVLIGVGAQFFPLHFYLILEQLDLCLECFLLDLCLEELRPFKREQKLVRERKV
jgi:hypothetical protein